MKFLLCSFLLLVTLSSCDPENLDPCSVEAIDGKSYLGFVNICNAVPENQLYFQSVLTISSFDTMLAISLISQDTLTPFIYFDTLDYACKETEPDLFVFNLFDSGSKIGNIGPSAQFLSLDLLNIENCLNNSTFEGVIIK